MWSLVDNRISFKLTITDKFRFTYPANREHLQGLFFFPYDEYESNIQFFINNIQSLYETRLFYVAVQAERSGTLLNKLFFFFLNKHVTKGSQPLLHSFHTHKTLPPATKFNLHVVLSYLFWQLVIFILYYLINFIFFFHHFKLGQFLYCVVLHGLL